MALPKTSQTAEGLAATRSSLNLLSSGSLSNERKAQNSLVTELGMGIALLAIGEITRKPHFSLVKDC